MVVVMVPTSIAAPIFARVALVSVIIMKAIVCHANVKLTEPGPTPPGSRKHVVESTMARLERFLR